MNINEFLNNEKNRPFALASMCADPLHHAHINIINEAKKLCKIDYRIQEFRA